MKFAFALLSTLVATAALAQIAGVNGSGPQFSKNVIAGGPAISSAGCSTGGPGNCVSGAVAWWGFRGYTTAYSGKVLNVCTALDAACEDESASGGNLVLGTVGTACLTSGTCLVKTLYDQSGALACAGGTACDVTQATAADQPSFAASVLNGLPCATFTNSVELETVTGLTQAQPFTFTGIAKNTAGSGAIIGIQFTATFGFSGSGTGLVAAGANLTATAAGGAFHTMVGVANGATQSSITVDGITTTGNAGSSSPANDKIFIGQESLTGAVCEGGIWPSAFTSTQIANMTNNQNSYWGL